MKRPDRTSYRTARLALVVALAAIMAFFALRSSAYLQYIPWMPRRLGVWADTHGILRNTIGFFVFSLVVYLLLGHGLRVVLTLAAFSAAIEIAQLWIPTRAFDLKDITASIAGVLLAWPFAWLLRRRGKPRASGS